MSSSSLPRLPELSHAYILQSVTHRSLYGPKQNAAASDNERLAFIGQGVLSACVSKIVHDAFPDHSAKVLNLVKNKFLTMQKTLLANYAVEFELIAHIQCAEANRKGLEQSVDFRASIMEAYIGALSIERGIDAVATWVADLLGPSIREIGVPFIPPPTFSAVTDVRPQSAASIRSEPSDHFAAGFMVGGLAKFNEIATQRYMRPEWSFESKGAGQDIQWFACLKIGGEVVGEGIGQSKQVSKEVAANRALQHLKWIKEP